MDSVDNKPIYAIKNDVTVSIEDVPAGLECGCICPACLGQLVAKKGEVRAHHFAHYKNNDCGYDYLYSLYLLAEKILKKQNKIYIPDNIICFNGGIKTIKTGFQLPINGIERKGGKRPELFVYYKGIPLQIKLLKSNKSFNRLKKEMAEKKQAAIGIDIGEIDEKNSKSLLKELLLSKTQKKIWLYSPKAAYEEEQEKKKDLIKHETDKGLTEIKEEIFCKTNIDSTKQLSQKKIEKAAEKLRNKLITERARELSLCGIKLGKSIEERDARITIPEAKKEYNDGISDWAKQARAKVEAFEIKAVK